MAAKSQATRTSAPDAPGDPGNDVVIRSENLRGLLGVSTMTLFRWVREGTFPPPLTMHGLNRWAYATYVSWLAGQIDKSGHGDQGGDWPVRKPGAPDDPNRLLPAAAVRKMLGGISKMTLWRWVDTGEIAKPLIIGSRNYWRYGVLREWLKRRTPPSSLPDVDLASERETTPELDLHFKDIKAATDQTLAHHRKREMYQTMVEVLANLLSAAREHLASDLLLNTLTPGEFALQLNLGDYAVRQMIAGGVIPCMFVSHGSRGRMRISKAALRMIPARLLRRWRRKEDRREVAPQPVAVETPRQRSGSQVTSPQRK